MEGTQPQGQKKTRHLPAHLHCSQPIFRTVNVSFIKISLYKCLLNSARFSRDSQEVTIWYWKMVQEGFGAIGSLASVGGLPVLYTDNYKKEVEGRWGTGMAWNHVRWTLGDNRQLLWSCGQIDWQVYKNAWKDLLVYKFTTKEWPPQVHYQTMTSTSTHAREPTDTCWKVESHAWSGRCQCLTSINAI